jgi:hypothetical protein
MRTRGITLVLVSLAALAWLPPADLRAQDAVADSATVAVGATAGTSPSQEARARLNQIRANEFFYQSNDREDPFKALVSGAYEASEGASELVDLASARLVGVMWGEEDRFALVEDGGGYGYILRVGDPVRNGTVVSIRTNAVTAQITLYGITNEVVLELDNVEAK